MKLFPALLLLTLSACANHKEIAVTIETETTDPELIKAVMNASAEDEKLHPEVSTFIKEEGTEQWQDNAYVYLWGMNYKTDDVYQTGLEIAKKLKKANEAFDYTSEFDSGFLDTYETIKMPENDEFCALREKGCFEEITENLNEKLAFAYKYRILRERFKQFISYHNYSDVSGWVNTFESPLPSYRQIIQGMNIQHVYWMEKLMSNDKESIIKNLTFIAESLKRFLVQADNLISKMVFVHMYSEQLEFINGALAKGWLKPSEIEQLPSLEPLVGAALSTELAWRKEEQVKMVMIQTMYHPDKVENVLIDLFYEGLPEKMIKPNAVLNTLYFELLLPLIAYNEQTPEAYYQGYDDFNIALDFDKTENLGGTLFNLAAEEIKERYLPYQARVFSLNMKIQLLQAIIEEGTAEKVIEKAQQGYTPYLNHFDQSAPFIKEGKLCYAGLYESNDRFRCLNIISPD